jgi:signal transduction histidine kinase
LIRTRQDLAAGRWSITSDQAGYFLGQLAGAPVLNVRTPFLAAATEARRLSAVSFAATDGTADHVLFAALGDERDFLQLAYRGNGANRIVGVALSLPWLREHVLPEVARGVVADRGAELVRLAAGHPSFHTMLPGWSVRLLPATNQRTSWLRADFIAFAAIAVVVIGVLVMGVLVLMRDIQRETKLNQLRADLVGGVSHELKTPLSVIRVYAETLDEVPDVAATDRRRFAKAIVQETERLRRLIDGVIDFSRIQQGQRAYALVPGSIAPLVARTAERFGEYLAVHDFALRTSIDMDVPPVEFDEIAVEQAVLNLLDNAFKYSGESRELAVSVCAEGQRVFVRVADHGVGIAPSDHHRVFERFQRGDHPDRGGYGLGLYLVRHIMAAHGGRVQLVSAPDEGSTFTLEFPTASEAIRQRVVRQAAVSHETSEVAYVEGAARRG